MSTTLYVDGVKHTIDADTNTPLLWILRDHLNLTNTKFGCGVAQCGACTVVVDNEALRSCSTPLSLVAGKHVITIANQEDATLKKLQNAWVEEDVAQCGYCQPGQIMNALALLKTNAKPNENEIIDAMNGNICRCGTYNRIKTAITKASKEA